MGLTKIFISYAEEDSTAAMRIAEDLARAQLTTWRYEVQGRRWMDFRQDIEQHINEAQWFCLLDSRHSRASKYVKEECESAKALERQGHLRLAICMIEADGSWRGVELFEGHNFIPYLDFFTDYDKAIAQLCELFESNYVPFSTVPRDIDFRIEIYRCDLNIQQRQDLIDDYALFRKAYEENHDAEDAEVFLRPIIRKCDRLGAKVMAPYLALGV